MNIPKAIEILTNGLPANQWKLEPDLKDAIKLGIEALIRIKCQYDPDHQMMRIPLPGETED